MKLGHRDGDGRVRDPDGEDQGSKITAEDGGEIRSRTERVCYWNICGRAKRSSSLWLAEG